MIRVGGAKESVGKALGKLKPVLRDAASAAGEAGQAKVREYASRAAAASREIAAETEELSGEERKKKMKLLVIGRIGGPFPIRWGLSPLVRRVVDIAVDFDDVRGCVRDSSSSPQKRKEASGVILKRLNAPFYVRWVARPVIGYALDVAAECSYLLKTDADSEALRNEAQTADACLEAGDERAEADESTPPQDGGRE